MARRWIIRGIFLWLLLLCVGGWVWSIWYDTSLVYWRYVPGRDIGPGPPTMYYSDAVIACVSERGHLIIGRGGTHWEGRVGEGWKYGQTPTYFYDWDDEWGNVISGWFEDWRNPTAWWTWGGKAVEQRSLHAGLDYALRIPYWLLTLVCSGCLYLSWRKPRAINPATAFPVEIEKSK